MTDHDVMIARLGTIVERRAAIDEQERQKAAAKEAARREAAADEAENADGDEERDQAGDWRFDAQDSLVAVINYLDAVDQGANLSAPLYRLMLALEQIERGGRVPWLQNGKPSPPVADEIRDLRGRCAAVMEIMMRDGNLKRDDAAKFVVTNLSKDARKALSSTQTGEASASSVKEWRSDTGEHADGKQADRAAYLSTFTLYSKAALDGRKFGLAVLAAVEKHAEKAIFDNTPSPLE